MKHRLTALFALLSLLAAIPATAQVNLSSLPKNSVVGRLGVSTGPAQAIPFATLAAQLQPGTSTNVSTCGAVGDGTTDDAPAIRTCAANVAAAGGGTVEFSCARTYLLGSLDTSGNGSILHPYSNVTYQGCGDSSVLKVKAGLNTLTAQFLVFYPPDSTNTYNYSNIGFRDFKIDNNGANNPTALGYQNVNIGCNYCTGVLIDNVTFTSNPGSQYIQIGNNSGINATDVRISGNRFIDGCDIVNAGCTDHSAIFIVASSYSISGNTFTNSSQSTKSTAMEMHGIAGTAIGNSILYYNKAINIVAQVSHTGRSLAFVGNTSHLVRYGVQCYATNTQILRDIVISNNTFQRSQEPVGSGVGFIDCGLASAITNANSQNIKITDNVISSIAAVGTAMTDPVIVIGQIQGIDVSYNQIYMSNGPCIGNNGNALDTTTRWTIKGNLCIDTGATSTAASRRGILLSSATTIDSATIAGNKIENVASTYMTTGIDVAGLNVTYGYFGPDNFVSNVSTKTTSPGTGWTSLAANSIPYSAGPGQPFSGMATAASSILVTDGSSVPSLSTTLPAFTLGGTVSGGGNQINNVIIGTSSPLAGTFTTVTANTSVQSPILKASSGIEFDVNGSTFAGSVSSAGKWIVGKNSTIGSAPIFSINANTNGTIPNPGITNNFTMVGADSATAGAVLQSFSNGAGVGVGPVIVGARAEGTAASPTAATSGVRLLQVQAYGYYTSGGPAYGFTAMLSNVATENYDSTHLGSRWDFWATPTGTASIAVGASVGAGFMVGGTTDPGAGAMLATASIKSNGATSGIGYATGAGGTVTQGAGSGKATAVTLNNITGAITMNNAALNAATIVTFVLNDSAIAATDYIGAAHESAGTTGAYTINCRATGAGTAACDVRNNTAGSLSEAIVIRFWVGKSVNSFLLNRDINPAANDNSPIFLEKAA